jgi:hypothetical protein
VRSAAAPAAYFEQFTARQIDPGGDMMVELNAVAIRLVGSIQLDGGFPVQGRVTEIHEGPLVRRILSRQILIELTPEDSPGWRNAATQLDQSTDHLTVQVG